MIKFGTIVNEVPFEGVLSYYLNIKILRRLFVIVRN